MDQSARRNPTDPMMEKAGKERLCSYYCYWSHTVANTQQFAMSPYGDFNASTFCGGLEIGNNCAVMIHSKPRLAVWWWWEQQVDCLCLCRLPRLLARTLPGD